MRDLLVLRHGQTPWNLAGRWQGWLDIELDDIGVEQARRRGRQLAADGVRVTGVVSSPLARALATARIVAAALGHDDIRTYPGLRERNGGAWQGLTRDEIDAQWPGALDALRRDQVEAPPGGETVHEMMARLDEALARIDDDMPDGAVLVVTHGGIARALAARAGAADRGVLKNVGGMWIEYDRGRTRAGVALPALADDPARPEGTLPVAPEVTVTDAEPEPH